MKRIILMRHSIAKRLNLPTDQIPLSDDGIEMAKKVKEKLALFKLSKCYSSPYLRAYQTALIINPPVEIENDLHERIIGEAYEDFWYKQYLDYDYKNFGGESLNEVKGRMKKAIDKILDKTEDEQTILVVSHAAAICAYLLNYCCIEVVDSEKRLRKITYQDKIILNGNFNQTDYFVISFDHYQINKIVFISQKDK